VWRRAKVSADGLGFFFCRFNIEEGRKRRSVKVTLGYPQALEEGEKPSKSMRKPWEARTNSHARQQLLLGQPKFQTCSRG